MQPLWGRAQVCAAKLPNRASRAWSTSTATTAAAAALCDAAIMCSEVFIGEQWTPLSLSYISSAHRHLSVASCHLVSSLSPSSCSLTSLFLLAAGDMVQTHSYPSHTYIYIQNAICTLTHGCLSIRVIQFQPRDTRRSFNDSALPCFLKVFTLPHPCDILFLAFVLPPFLNFHRRDVSYNSSRGHSSAPHFCRSLNLLYAPQLLLAHIGSSFLFSRKM